MRKIIFVPFPLRIAGTLATALQFGGEKPDKGDKQGRYRGFKNEERIFSPDKAKDEYQRTGLLSELRSADDQLYINAHCLKGKAHLSTRVDCSGENNVTVADLVLQIKAHCLPEDTPCKIKLWVCEGGLDDGINESFAKRFSKTMFESGYRDCQIFGYTLSLLSSYVDGSDGEGLRKRAVKPEVAGGRVLRLKNEIATLNANAKDPFERLKARMWAAELRAFDGDVDRAMESVLTSETKSKALVGTTRPWLVPGLRQCGRNSITATCWRVETFAEERAQGD